MGSNTAFKMYLWATGIATTVFVMILGFAAFQPDLTMASPLASRLDVFCNDNMTDMMQSGYSECLNPETHLVLGRAGELYLYFLQWMWGGLVVLYLLKGLVAFLTVITDDKDEVTSDTAA